MNLSYSYRIVSSSDVGQGINSSQKLEAYIENISVHLIHELFLFLSRLPCNGAESPYSEV